MFLILLRSHHLSIYLYKGLSVHFPAYTLRYKKRRVTSHFIPFRTFYCQIFALLSVLSPVVACTALPLVDILAKQ